MQKSGVYKNHYSLLHNLEHITQLSRLKIKVKGFALEFRACFISTEPLNQFSWNFTNTFLLVILCAEQMTQLPRLKVKVTSQRPRIYPWISCSLHISWTLWSISMILHSYFPLSKKLCWAHDPATQTQCQGHQSWSKGLPLNLVFAQYLLNSLIDFHDTSLVCFS